MPNSPCQSLDRKSSHREEPQQLDLSHLKFSHNINMTALFSQHSQKELQQAQIMLLAFHNFGMSKWKFECC